MAFKTYLLDGDESGMVSLNGSYKLFQKPDVVLTEEAQVVDLVFEHGYSFYAHSKSIAGVFITVDAAILKQVSVHHSAAQYLNLSTMFANVAACSATYQAAYIHFGTWLGKWKIGRSETNLDLFTKHFLHKEIECLFEVGE